MIPTTPDLTPPDICCGNTLNSHSPRNNDQRKENICSEMAAVYKRLTNCTNTYFLGRHTILAMFHTPEMPFLYVKYLN